MAQKTDLNISPYYDDFDGDKNFYKVLFKPGFPVQARELTTLQSILQNQVESFGGNIFKEGSMVLPGSVTFDNQFSAVKLNSINLGIDISVYIKNFIGKKITGQLSGVTASIQEVALTSDSDLVTDVTIYVKYGESGEDSEADTFQDGEQLFASENVTYGNTTINSGTAFASLISQDATSTGSAAFIDNGVYFIRGTFVEVSKQTLILDYYTNTPSYRVGLKISETIVNAKDDSSLYDNASGFTNFAAPGADRLKIALTLTKKEISNNTDTDFVEILRVDEGKIKKIENKPVYNLIRDFIAERTFDESGHYAIDELSVKALNSLNDQIDNDGLYLEGEITEQGNIPSDDLMCLQVSPGKAYVDGYDVTLDAETAIDVEKPRDIESISSTNIPFEMGHLLRVNNVSGAPKENETLDLFNQLQDDGSGGTKIGIARVYTFNLTDAAYTDASTQWDLYLYDIQTFTNVTFNRSVTATEIPTSSFIKGKSSGASGFVVLGQSASSLNLSQTSGTFVTGEKLIVNGIETALTITSFIQNNINQLKSVSKTGVSGFPNFKADAVLNPKKFSNGISEINVASTTVTSPGKLFSGVKVGDLISVIQGNGLRYNRITAISSDLASLTITNISSVNGVFTGTAISNGNYTANLRVAEVKNSENGFLYANLPESNISSVDLSNSQLAITKQITGESTNGSGEMVFGLPTGITSAFYESFDQERYSVHYTGGGIGTITSDAFTLTGGGSGVEIEALETSEANIVVNTTLKKNGIQSKIKNFTRSAIKVVNLSKLVQSGSASSISINDGLTYNQYYGLRVQDDQISLNVPDVSKVLVVYESTNTADPTLDAIEFSSISNVGTDAIIGENIIGSESGAVGRVVTNNSSSPSSGGANKLGVVYLNQNTFIAGETVTFKESNIISTVQSITLGKYNNITDNFVLDGGQKNEYYDYSRLIRTTDSEPSKRLLVVFDHYVVPASDTGDVFTVLSYDSDRFLNDIPKIGPNNIRASDTLDFRPRVVDYASTTASPFNFDSRTFTTNFNLKPGESSILGYEFYLPRIDKLYLDKFENLIISKGVSAKEPKPSPSNDQSLMELATIVLPPYLYNPDNVSIDLVDNRRYTMRDIGQLEDRIENLERVTSLSLLEVSTEALRVEDEDGNNRFKSGFFVDNFTDRTSSDQNLTSADISEGQLRPRLLSNSLRQRVLPSSEIPEEDLDLTTNYELLDPNIQKTGNVVTLKYDSIDWLEQPLATRVENVNPFHVIEYVGNVKLSPENDFWIRTIYIPPSVRNITRRTTNVVTNTIRNTVTLPSVRTETGEGTRVRETRTIETNSSSRVQTSRNSRTRVNVRSRDVLISSGDEQYIRSRNVSFFGRSLKPLTRHYQFLDSHSNVDFIPKLLEIANSTSLENSGSSEGAFTSGETIKVYENGSEIGRFRLANSNHKEGSFKSPSRTYNINPYARKENLPNSYSQSSKTLNIDLNSLSNEAQGRFFGYVTKGAKIVGQTSGAIAYVKNLRLISDNYGDLFGSFFIKNPHTNPAPNPRILTGKKTYLLTSSSTNAKPLPGSKLISTGQGSYSAVGTLLTRQIQTTVTRTIETTLRRTTTVTTTRREVVRARRSDPLAQSFVVGRDIDAPDLNGFSSDDKGVVLTELDLYFANKPAGNEPLEVQIRTVELGIPTLNLVGESKTLYPDEIATSTTGETATRVTFDEPKYLAPGNEYAVVLLAPTSDEYEVWIAKMGEKTVNTQSLPDAESVIYTKQFALGSLFKSQNGSIWTPTQELDLKFKLYKAKFTANTGIAYFGNPPLDQSNGYVNNLLANPVTGVPKTTTLGVTTFTDSDLIDTLNTGRKIAGSIPNSYGYIEYAGGPVTGITTTNGGENYTNQSNLATTNIVGNGSGLRLSITQTNGVITGITRTADGTGYEVGDVVTVTSGTTGRGALITISAITGRDTLYLTDVQGEVGGGNAFPVGAGVSYYDTDTTIVSLGSTQITSATEGTGVNSGNFLEVSHFNHGMYANNNKLQLNGVKSDVSPSILTVNLSVSSGSTSVSVENSSVFETFEGLPVSASNPGYVKIGDEVMSYEGVSSNQLTTIGRGVEGKVESHEINAEVQKYEFNGVSLRRINNVIYDISDIEIDSNGYYIEVDRSATYGVNRSADTATLPQLSFNRKFVGGGNDVFATENIQFNSVNPRFFVQAPGDSTSVSAVVRTTTGTSIDGSETSFQLLNEVEPVELNSFNNLKSTRIVCSRVNELQQPEFNNVSGRRSFTTAITLNSTDENLSPIINLEDSTVQFASNYLNRPVTNFATDSRVNSILNDPHSAIYVSNTIGLSKPASSLKVILGAFRPASSDIRVLYSLVRDDSSEIEQEFELFPGHENLVSTSDGGFKVVDPALNNGKSDIKVPASSANQFLEYEFTADNLGEFSGYSIKIIMSGTDQANSPIISDLRTIALA
jgi:hypothetical protein|tara:strand:- start:265 stop:7563 length:7299 start_codon:yes stop_codon:yes gene_type:complete